MTIIEFAYLSLPPPTTSKTSQLLKNLVTVTDVIQASSHLPTRFFSSLTDDNVMFVIGGWPSKAAHQDGFDGSAEQAKLFPLIEGMMQIDWMEYLDTPHERVPTDANCLVATVLRCGVSSNDDDGQRKQIWEKMQETLGTVREGLDRSRQDEQVPKVCAWNLKKGKQVDEEDVLVSFSGFENVQLAKQFGDGVHKQSWPEQVKKLDVYYMKKTEIG